MLSIFFGIGGCQQVIRLLKEQNLFLFIKRRQNMSTGITRCIYHILVKLWREKREFPTLTRNQNGFKLVISICGQFLCNVVTWPTLSMMTSVIQSNIPHSFIECVLHNLLDVEVRDFRENVREKMNDIQKSGALIFLNLALFHFIYGFNVLAQLGKAFFMLGPIQTYNNPDKEDFKVSDLQKHFLIVCPDTSPV